MDLLLGIDVGTYSTKGVLTSLDGRVQRIAVREHVVEMPQPGWAEQDADRVWWADVGAVCRELLDDQPFTGASVVAVGISAIGPCMLPLDEDDRPLRPGILYGVDTRAAAEIAELEEHIGSGRIRTLARMELSSQAVGPKILWYRRNEPENWLRTARITTASSYLVHRLTGEHVIDHHQAAHFIPLYDAVAQRWTGEYSDMLVSPSRLPRLQWSDEIAGTVTSDAAQTTGLVAGTPVVVGGVDAVSEAISVGLDAPGDLMIMYGSSAFFLLATPGPVEVPSLWTLPGAFKDTHMLAAGMATAGSLTRWFRDTLANDLEPDTAYDQLFDQAATVAPGSKGLLVLPYFSGERTPINDPHARGLIAGLSLTHTRSELFRASLEGVGFGIRHNLETLTTPRSPVRRYLAVGGGARSDTWLQIVSDIADIEQQLAATTVGASFGDAFLAGVGSGHIERTDASAWFRGDRVIRPTRESQQLYDNSYRLFKELYRATADISHQLAGSQ